MLPEMEAQRELETGETILWAGRPDPKQSAMQTIPFVIFGAFWTSILVFMVVSALTGASRTPGAFSFVFVLFGLPFLLIGLGMLSSPIWARRSAENTAYAVTNQRIIVIKVGRTRNVRSYRPADIGNLDYTERPDGSGSLTFAQRTYQSSNGQTNVARDQFIGIPNVRTVEKLIRDTLKTPQAGI